MLGETYEMVALAPDLLIDVRRTLSSRGLSKLQIDSRVKKLGSPKRYQSAFAIFFAMALRDGLTIDSPSDLFAGLLKGQELVSLGDTFIVCSPYIFIYGAWNALAHHLHRPYTPLVPNTT